MTPQELFKYGIDHDQFPRVLYKYRTVASALRFLGNPGIYFSAARSFNDPFEFKAILKPSTNVNAWADMMMQEGLPRLEAYRQANLVVSNPLRARQVLENAVTATQNTLGVFCMSKVCDQLLMWAHYADEHRGVCFGFDLAEDLDTFNFPKAVEYSDTYPTVIHPHRPLMTTEPLFHKSSHWAYEQEYRIIKLNRQGLIPVRPEALREIIFGCRCTAADEAAIRTAASPFPNVTFRHARLSPTSYSLNIV